MKKGRELCIILLGVSLFSRCNTSEYKMPTGHEWKTCGGHLFIKAGNPSRYLTVEQGISWEENSWLVHNKEKPKDVEIVPLDSEIKQMIVKTMNAMRAKVLLGAYFDPEKAREFGYTPPGAQMNKVAYSEDIARTTERYIQHYIFNHYIHNSFYPHVPLGENLYLTSGSQILTPEEKGKTLDQIVIKYLNPKHIMLTAFKEWFDLELPFYKHFEPNRYQVLHAMVDELFRKPIINNPSLTEEEKKKKLDDAQFGHFIAIAANNIHSVGCALTRKGKLVNENRNGTECVKYEYSYYFACNFGGSNTDGVPLYYMDENLLEQHGLSKSQFDFPSDN